MSTPANVFPFPRAVEPVVASTTRTPFASDAALPHEAATPFIAHRLPFAEASHAWLAQIASERLSDVPIASLHALSVDHRDGALVRGAGGACYTPHAWSQLVGLMRAEDAPAGIANAFRWLAPLARHHAWADVVRRSKRPRAEEGIARMMVVGERSTFRAVVSGRHSLHHFDDRAVAGVLAALSPAYMSVSRNWNETRGVCALAPTYPDVRLGFSFRNSETGCASLSFAGSIVIRALDVVVEQPSGARFERLVQIASDRGAARRRHTLPRYSGSSGSRLSEAARQRVANARIEADVDTALTASSVLAERWGAACADVFDAAVQVARITAVDDFALTVLRDLLLDTKGIEQAGEPAFVKALATVIADDARLRSLPHGSAAHMAGALAVLASQAETWAAAQELQQLAGRFVVEGWAR